MFKKIMLLALAAAAIVAVAAPAAQANRLWHGGPGLTGGTGSLTWVSSTGLSTGPAPVTFSGTVTNGGVSGLITFVVINNGAGGIPTNLPGCSAQVTAGGAAPVMWPVHLSTPDTMTISNVKFTNHYSGASCAAAGVPPSVSMTGSVWLTITGARSASAEPYNETTAATLAVYNPLTGAHTSPAIGVDIKGTVSWTGGGTIT